MGLLGGALGGMMIGDMISDAGDYSAGYEEGYEDAGDKIYMKFSRTGYLVIDVLMKSAAVIDRLNVLRGSGIVSMYSWYCKRQILYIGYAGPRTVSEKVRYSCYHDTYI
ncbi:hypothetical protein AgCh_002661 [Apium graveolens]